MSFWRLALVNIPSMALASGLYFHSTQETDKKNDTLRLSLRDEIDTEARRQRFTVYQLEQTYEALTKQFVKKPLPEELTTPQPS